MVKAVINRTGGVSAKINSTTSSGPQKVSVTTPTAQVNVDGVRQLRSLTDVNSSTLVDGALIQYDASSDKFITRNELETTSGTITFNGGNF
jgi:hypothetical protein|tara:strand:+ start:23978 stop:24250 length:273 start_codon:yes stop_codon:yes gene_type:complete